MSATLGTAWGWVVFGLLLGVLLYIGFWNVVEWWQQRRREPLSGRATLTLMEQGWTRWDASGSRPATPAEVAWFEAQMAKLDSVFEDFNTLPLSTFQPPPNLDKALPDKPMHYSTLDELLGPTIEEPPA